ncbi:MAG: DUF4124 domain-containing protein [Fibrobacter sp.]|nr:DUF4124 domain-containing protein [Fibrobacter sp.]
MRILFLITLCLIIFSNTAFAGEIYTWTDKKGVEHITTTPPPEYAKVKDRSTFKRDDPRQIEAFQRKQKAAIDKGFTGWQARQTKTPTVRETQGPREDKCKGVSDKWKDAYREYNEEKNRNNSGKPSSKEKSLRAAMFKAQEEEHACIFSPENIESGRVYVEKTTVTIKRGK